MSLTLTFLVFAAATIGFVALLLWVDKLATGNHSWRYYNPANRECTKCGLVENQYEYFGDPQNTRWEPVNSLHQWQWCHGPRRHI